MIIDSKNPFIIAEIGSNFDQSLNKAFKLIKLAKECGASAVKFQLFDPDILYPNNRKMNKIFKSVQLNPSWVPKLKKCCNENKIFFIVSPFDLKSLDILIRNNIDAYKIASSEATNYPLLKKISQQKKKIILSTGMCDLDDVVKAKNILTKNYNNLAIMQCHTSYPLNPIDCNLNVIKTYKKKFKKHVIGFSDHTLGYEAALTAIGAGATLFEKHITISKKSKGPDHFYAAEIKEFKEYVIKIKNSFNLMGSYKKDFIEFEKKYGRREGIYINCNLKKGSKIKKNNLLIKRPALGVRSKYIGKIIGKRLLKKLTKGQAIYFDNLK